MTTSRRCHWVDLKGCSRERMIRWCEDGAFATLMCAADWTSKVGQSKGWSTAVKMVRSPLSCVPLTGPERSVRSRDDLAMWRWCFRDSPCPSAERRSALACQDIKGAYHSPISCLNRLTKLNTTRYIPRFHIPHCHPVIDNRPRPGSQTCLMTQLPQQLEHLAGPTRSSLTRSTATPRSDRSPQVSIAAMSATAPSPIATWVD